MLKYRLGSQNLNAGWGLLFKILLLDTAQAPGSKTTATLRSCPSLEEILWHFIAESQGASNGSHWRSLSSTAAPAQDHLAAAVQAVPPLTYFIWPLSGVWVSFTSKSSCRSPARWPGTAEHLRVCWFRGCLSSDRYPDLAGTQVPGLFCCRLFGHWHLKPPYEDVPEPGLGEVQHLRNIRRIWVLLHVNVEQEGRDSSFSQEWKYLFRITFKVWLYFKKQYRNGTRKLYILPVLIPTCAVFNKEIERLLC